MSKDEHKQPEMVCCSWCGREFGEVRGVSHLRARCDDCSRMTYYAKDARELDKPQHSVNNRERAI